MNLLERGKSFIQGINVKSPVRQEYRNIVVDSGDPGYINRLLVATPTTGLVRIEWVAARYGQIVPPNWSMTQLIEYVDSLITLRYAVDDAQNLIVKGFLERDYEWLFLLEHDVILPPDAFIHLNEHMRSGKVPVISGLYYTRARPSEPVVYRGRGNSYYGTWKAGEQVWCDGVPTGCLLIHRSILQSIWNDSAEYSARGTMTRKVFETPRKVWFDPESNQFNSQQGTSDLDWCSRLIEGNYFTKAGWPQIQAKRYPLLVDTRIFCKHIDQNGTQYP